MKPQVMSILTVASCFLTGVAAQDTQPRDAKAVFDHATQLVAAGADIWPGFEFRRYAALATDNASGAGSVRFSNATGDKVQQVFMVVNDEYNRGHTLEEDLS